jgi:hypothetical protein
MSLVNAIIAGSGQPEPFVGMPVSVCMYSDRSVAEIAEIIRFKTGARKGEIKAVTLRSVEAIIVSGGEHDGSAQYRYERKPDSAPHGLYTKDSRGRFVGRNGGPRLALGTWDYYRDPSF